MKKILILLTIIPVALTWCAQAGLILSDTFSYADGYLTNVSSGAWYPHLSGSPILVTNGQIRVLGASSAEDDSSDLAGAPYATNSGVVLYSSYTMIISNQSGLPSRAGGYISHFKNTGVGNSYHCRVFVSTSNYIDQTLAPDGTYFVGIGNGSLGNGSAAGSTPVVQLTNALSTNVIYTVVTRCNLGNNQESTVWINPSSESGYHVTATDYNDPTNQAAMSSYAFRQNSGGGTVYVDNLKIGTQFSDVAGANTAPLISTIPPQSAAMNAVIGPLSFTVADAETVASSLTVTRSSTNTTLVPVGNIFLAVVPGTGGTNRTVTITPASGQQGRSLITLSVSDGVNTSSTSFLVTVGKPSIGAIPSQTAITNTAVPDIPFTVSDPEGDTLTLFASSSNPGVLADDSIAINGSGNNWTVTLVPNDGVRGVTYVTVSVTDGFNTNSTTFSLTMRPLLGLLFADDFNYTNFPYAAFVPEASNALLYAEGSLWNSIGGTAFQTKVTNGWVYLHHTNSEDLGISLSSTNYGSNAVVYYVGFHVNFSYAPSTGGEYFLHLKSSGDDTINFRCKVFAHRVGAATNQFRLGIANQANLFVPFPRDLSLNTPYAVVARYNSATGESVLWIDPRDEQSQSAVATDSQGTSTIGGIGLRQPSGSIGDMGIDFVRVGTSWMDVADPYLSVQRIGDEAVVSWPQPTPYHLESALDILGPYSEVFGATNPYTNSSSERLLFFRLGR